MCGSPEKVSAHGKISPQNKKKRKIKSQSIFGLSDMSLHKIHQNYPKKSTSEKNEADCIEKFSAPNKNWKMAMHKKLFEYLIKKGNFSTFIHVQHSGVFRCSLESSVHFHGETGEAKKYWKGIFALFISSDYYIFSLIRHNSPNSSAAATAVWTQNDVIADSVCSVLTVFNGLSVYSSGFLCVRSKEMNHRPEQKKNVVCGNFMELHTFKKSS